MRFTVFSVAGTFLVAILVMALWPEPARFGAPDVASAQDQPQSANQDPDSSKSRRGRRLPLQSVVPDQAAVRDVPARTVTSVVQKPSRSTEMSRDIEEKLKLPLNIVYEETPFQDVLDELRERLGVPVMLDASAREDALTEEVEISYQLGESVPGRTALQLLLGQKNATYVIKDGVLLIISRDLAESREYMRRKMFDCRRLISAMQKTGLEVSTPRTSAGEGMGLDSGASGLEGASAGLAGGAVAACADTDAVEARLKRLIQAIVEPQVWKETEGEATLEFIEGIAVVVAPEETLNQVEDLLVDLTYEIGR